MHVRINLHNVSQPPISYGPMTSHPRGAQIPLILHPFGHATRPRVASQPSIFHIGDMCLADGLPAQCQPARPFVRAHDESPAGCSNSAHPASILPCHPLEGGQSTLHPPHWGHPRMCLADGLPTVTSSMVPLCIFGGHARPRATPPTGKKRSPWDPHREVYGRRGWALRGILRT